MDLRIYEINRPGSKVFLAGSVDGKRFIIPGGTLEKPIKEIKVYFNTQKKINPGCEPGAF